MAATASLLANAAIAVLSVGAWLHMLLGLGGDATLSARGIGSFKYYTVLSNLFSGFVSGMCAAAFLTLGSVPLWLLTLKIAATATVMVTFLTVILLVGPTLGWKGMYSGGNFWMHGALPLFAALDCVFLLPVADLPVWATLWAMTPTALYAVFYLRMVWRGVTHEERRRIDFYGFLRWGEDKAYVVATVMILIAWLVALALYGASALALPR